MSRFERYSSAAAIAIIIVADYFGRRMDGGAWQLLLLFNSAMVFYIYWRLHRYTSARRR
jgi:hypothetical protein